jgi:hypothetical protein
MVHPTVVGAEAEACPYQIWPIDETNQWAGKYSLNQLKKGVGKGTKRYVFGSLQCQHIAHPVELKIS